CDIKCRTVSCSGSITLVLPRESKDAYKLACKRVHVLQMGPSNPGGMRITGELTFIQFFDPTLCIYKQLTIARGAEWDERAICCRLVNSVIDGSFRLVGPVYRMNPDDAGRRFILVDDETVK